MRVRPTETGGKETSPCLSTPGLRAGSNRERVTETRTKEVHLAFSIFRLSRLHGLSDIAGLREHHLRLKDVPNSDGSGVEIIRDLDPAGWRALIDNTRHRSDAVLAYDVVCTFSGMGGVDPWSPTPEQLVAWKTDTLKWLSDTFGDDNIRVAAYHTDEQTPHIQALITPIETKVNKKGKAMTSFNARKWTGAKNALGKLQDSYHAVMKKFGLQRGVAGTKAKHVDIREYYASVNQAAAEGYHPGPGETAVDYLARHPDLIPKATESASLKRRNYQLEKSLPQWRAEADRLRDIDLNTLMTDLGYERDPDDSDARRSVYRTPAGKVSVQGTKFYDFGSDRGGGGAIDLVMHVQGCGFRDALGILRGLYGADRVTGAIIARQVESTRADIEKIPARKPFSPAGSAPAKLDRVVAYLRSRGLSAININDAIRRGDLYANRWGSCVFLHRDAGGKPKGATIRGTGSDFKQSVGDKRGAWYTAGCTLDVAREITIVESPIDALSWIQLHPDRAHDTCVVSLAGHSVPSKLVQAVGRRNVIVALDNPRFETPAAQGNQRKAVEAARYAFTFARIELPENGKDWNELAAKKWRGEQEEERRVKIPENPCTPVPGGHLR